MENKVNIRAIDSEELLQIIDNSNGIYESTIVKLLQCNRISLESRLNTLEKNELISKKKINKKFYYTRKYDINNILNLDLQSDAVQCLVNHSLYTESIIITNSKNKKVMVNLISSINNLNENNRLVINKLLNETHISKQADFKRFFDYYTFKIPVVISSMLNSESIYKTENLDNIELLAIKNEEQLLKIKGKLKDLSYLKNFKDNEFIREDILIYIQELNSIHYFIKNSGKYELIEIKNIIDFIFFISNHSLTTTNIYFSENQSKFKKMIELYIQSSNNKKKYNTVNQRQNKN
ncbi:hypothetical protein [Vagococcus fluvialis]|uniref:hypothetical protein n=1 Tax=Vagococcus fluvialis TaxID=2738 RepID=UPI003D0BE8FF